MADRMMRPLKGDLRVQLRMQDGTITVLIEREKVKPHHIAAIKKMADILANELLAASSAQEPSR